MYYGLLIVFLAWLWQWYSSSRRGLRSLGPWFLRLSFIGFLFVALDTFNLVKWVTWSTLGILAIIILLMWRSRR